MRTSKVLAVEGSSELAVISALSAQIDQLSVRRNAYSHAHELSHRLLIVNGADTAAKNVVVAIVDGFAWSRVNAWRPPTDWASHFPGASVLPSRLDSRLLIGSSTPHLPTWCTSDFAGMPAGMWLRTDPQAGSKSTSARTAPPHVLYCLLVSAGSTIVDGWASIVRVFDRVLAALHLMRIRVRTGIRHHPNALTFVLVMLAACRHYGKRSEPDDHASLVIRRHLVSMGSCPQT